MCRLPGREALGQLDDALLAFTGEEAAAALVRLGLPVDGVEAAVQATNGWITGVLFGPPGQRVHTTGLGGETDPLYEFLSSQIVEQLDAQDRWFLTATSLLDEVDAERATALGQEDAAERLRSLRTVHLPATWLATGARLRCQLISGSTCRNAWLGWSRATFVSCASRMRICWRRRAETRTRWRSSSARGFLRRRSRRRCSRRRRYRPPGSRDRRAVGAGALAGRPAWRFASGDGGADGRAQRRERR